jgi:hypothetical protein
MVNRWQRRQILIWGKTRPELSTKYKEIVCTGGVFKDMRRLVRLYPIPLRYLDDEKIFKKYQWIEAFVTKSTRDPRPESYKIRFDEIEVLDYIPAKAGNWDARAQWIMQPGNIFQSVETLKERQQKDHTSLGLVQPLDVNDICWEPLSENEQNEFWKRYRGVAAQMELEFDLETEHQVNPLKPPDFRFKIKFRCNDNGCRRDHNFSILDWEIDALYFSLRKRGDSREVAADKVVEKLRNQVCAPDKDLYFFLGNIATHPHIFTIVGFWWPKRKRQPKLFNH